MTQVNQRVCPRCRTPVRVGGKVCERCEQPLDGPVSLRYNPAGLALPSPIQGHATVLVGIVAAVVLLVFGAWFLNHGVGPFRAVEVGRSLAPDGSTVVRVLVHNDGDRGGKARCRVNGVSPDGSLLSSPVRLSPAVGGHGEAAFTLTASGMRDAHEVSASCS